jgi:hypothetical protein
MLGPHQQAAATDCSDLPKALKAASEIRGLAIKREVPCQAVDKETFKEIMRDLYWEDTGDHHQERTEIVYKMAGFIPKEFNYKKCYVDESGEAVGAFYHPTRKTVFIPSFASTNFDVLVHEATHALQDQHYDLGKMAKYSNTSSDSALAFAAIIEGDAESVQRKYVQQHGRSTRSNDSIEAQGQSDNECQLPSALLFQLEFPYSWGNRYISILEKLGKISTDEVLGNLPKTTTQILYPKYSLPKKLGKPTLEDLSALSLKQLPYQPKLKKPGYSDTWGEYTLRCILRQYVGSKRAVLGAKGWMYDTVSLSEFQNAPGKYLMNMATVWESEKDAGEFKKAFIQSIGVRTGSSIRSKVSTVLFSTQEYPLVFVKQDKTQVFIIVSEFDYFPN